MAHTKKYSVTVVGGTFDHLHAGHKKLLSKAFEVGEQVLIGLTTDKFVEKFKSFPNKSNQPNLSNKSNKSNLSNFPNSLDRFSAIASYHRRKATLCSWLSGKGWLGRTKIVPLNDPYGPVVPVKIRNFPSASLRPPFGLAQGGRSGRALRTGKLKIKNLRIDSIVVSTQTRTTAEKINILRKKASLKPLDIVEIPMVKAQDRKPIASTRIRKIEIDGNGKLVLPDNLRPELRKPLGIVITDDKKFKSIIKSYKIHTIISVGDVSTQKLLDFGIIPFLSIIDLKVNRMPFKSFDDYRFPKKIKVILVKSGPGYISQSACQAIKDTLCRKSKTVSPSVILVDGEEDLLVLPAVKHALSKSIIFYGQPAIYALRHKGIKEGIVLVRVTKHKKKVCQAFLTRFLLHLRTKGEAFRG